MSSIEPRTAIVTGAGKRVGAVIASALAADGWTVVAHVHHAEDSVPPGTVKVVADLADADCAKRIFAAADGLPPVSLLVNNAARFDWDGPAAFNPDVLDQQMAVNARAPALLIEALAERHDGTSDASVVNILDSKIAAPNPDYLSYTISKQALAAITDLYARALARKRIRINGIAPGLMLQSSGQSDSNFKRMHADNPLRRGVAAADVLEAIRYLAGAPCVTGQILIVDSGQRYMGLERDVQFLGED